MKTVVLTGASGGMGRAISACLKSAGYTVWALDISKTEDANFTETDITDESSVISAFNKVKNHSKNIDAIVHAAGIYNMNSLVEMTEEETLRIFNINLLGPMRVNRIFLPLFNAKSKIIMISSELAPLDPLPFTGIYGITKNTVEKYAYSLRMELQLLGHTVTIIRPGAVKTSFLNQSKEKIQKFCNNTVYYKDISERFNSLVDKIESSNVSPEKIGSIVLKVLNTTHPKYVYNINRSPMLRFFNALPQHAQNFLIKKALTS